MGSRFALLGNNIPLLEEDDNVVTNEETLIANVDKSQHGNMHKNQHVKDTRLGTKKVTQSLHVLQKGDQYIENLKRSSDAISGPNAQTRIQARKIGHGIHMENNFDVALMEEDTNKVTLHNTREDYNRVTHGPEETKDMNSTKNLSHPHVGPNHAPRPPDIVTGSLKSNPILQRIPSNNDQVINIKGDTQYGNLDDMEIVAETPSVVQGIGREVVKTPENVSNE
ncbi:hypothetical protein P8452_03546 [Trifolium repens]|nr:hypothetical protein P8452_03546 [Trifolium repens]